MYTALSVSVKWAALLSYGPQATISKSKAEDWLSLLTFRNFLYSSLENLRKLLQSSLVHILFNPLFANHSAIGRNSRKLSRHTDWLWAMGSRDRSSRIFISPRSPDRFWNPSSETDHSTPNSSEVNAWIHKTTPHVFISFVNHRNKVTSTYTWTGYGLSDRWRR